VCECACECVFGRDDRAGYVSACMCVWLWIGSGLHRARFVCVSVCERVCEREKDRERCVCVYVCMCVIVNV